MNKILVITSNIAPYRLSWCEELAKYFDVDIVYTKNHDFERDDRWVKTKSNKCKLIKLKNSNAYDPLCFDVIKVIKENNDSLIIFDGYGPKTNLLGLIYCKFINKEVFINVDGYPTERNVNYIKKMIKKFVIKHLCPNFFCGGENVKQHLISHGANKEKVFVHNLSSIKKDEIDSRLLTKKEKISIRKVLNIDYKNKIVLAVGRFLPLKRFEDLILAVKKCQSDCELIMLGGKPTDKYIELVGDSKNIHFIDFVLPEAVYKYYEMADLFVLPSETDVWGLVINEAMAKGLPIIASDSVVAASNLIKDNGYIFETYNVDELSKYIDICLDDNNNKQMSKNSLKIIKEYTIEGMVERQLPIINEYFKL